MKAISVKLPDALRVRLQAEAVRRGVSLGQVVREAADTYVVKSPTQKRMSLYERSRHLCGCLDSGLSDLASNPKHLEGMGLDSMGDRGHRSTRRLPRPR